MFVQASGSWFGNRGEHSTGQRKVLQGTATGAASSGAPAAGRLLPGETACCQMLEAWGRGACGRVGWGRCWPRRLTRCSP